MADSEAALKSRPCVAFVIRSALVCLETGNPWVTTKGTDTKAASKSRLSRSRLGRPPVRWPEPRAEGPRSVRGCEIRSHVAVRL